MPNIKQFIAIVVGALFTWLSSQFNFGVAPEDVQNTVIAIFMGLYTSLSHDANEVPWWKQKTLWTGVAGSIFWFLSTAAHIGISQGVQTAVLAIIGTLHGYYTLNHTSAIHEIKGTVGEISPAFK